MSAPFPRMREGYRYVRSYHVGGPHADPWWNRWALWEVQGGRARRVGTARTEEEYKAFLAAPKLARLSTLGR